MTIELEIPILMLVQIPLQDLCLAELLGAQVVAPLSLSVIDALIIDVRCNLSVFPLRSEEHRLSKALDWVHLIYLVYYYYYSLVSVCTVYLSTRGHKRLRWHCELHGCSQWRICMLKTLKGALQRAVFLINTSPMTNDVALHKAFFKNYLKCFLKVPQATWFPTNLVWFALVCCIG